MSSLSDTLCDENSTHPVSSAEVGFCDTSESLLAWAMFLSLVLTLSMPMAMALKISTPLTVTNEKDLPCPTVEWQYFGRPL